MNSVVLPLLFCYHLHMIYLCLVEPEIPQNTGNIARTAALTGSVLVLIHPLGFSLDEKSVRRSGLDYWKDVDIIEEKSFDEFISKHTSDELYFFSSHGEKSFCDIEYPLDKDIYLVFGKESTGLGERIISQNRDRTLRIPIKESQRCLNLSNSVAVALYEVLRQRDYRGLKK